MSIDTRTVFTYLGAIGTIAAVVLILVTEQPAAPVGEEAVDTAQVANVASTYEPTSPELAASNIPTQENAPPPPSEPSQKMASVRRIQNPYNSPPLSARTVIARTRAALVNILCITDNAPLQTISGSGVIIDPRGIILTNAHVGQYVLLAQSGRTSLSCTIRTGAPAEPRWHAEVLYIPPTWIREHAKDITKAVQTGTGEHDYALLLITDLSAQSAPPASFPYLPVDTREGIGFPTDTVLVASYPSEFAGPQVTQFNLNPATSLTSAKELLTFSTDTVDLLSVGGVPAAQSGSSGGAIVNMWGYLIGIITTTSEGPTTADRELRALTLSYINRDLRTQTGLNLAELLAEDPAALAAHYRANLAPPLTNLLIDQIANTP
ncbi:trypsin-like peptidase domain-containing protein [Candidatus Kaiserbacteria bacterium]|nr:trypsin-like peptidase domain-containing protein [Candidatus Kaiserbacteria bacterium]